MLRGHQQYSLNTIMYYHIIIMYYHQYQQGHHVLMERNQMNTLTPKFHCQYNSNHLYHFSARQGAKQTPGSSCFVGKKSIIANIVLTITFMIVRELNRQLQELQIQLQRNRAKIAEDAQQLEVTKFLTFSQAVGGDHLS